MKLKYEIEQDIESCNQCRFCHNRFEIESTDDPNYELYCLLKNPGYQTLKLIKVIKARKLGYVTIERPEWCPLKPIKE